MPNPELSRRTFLKTAAIAVGGLVVSDLTGCTSNTNPDKNHPSSPTETRATQDRETLKQTLNKYLIETTARIKTRGEQKEKDQTPGFEMLKTEAGADVVYSVTSKKQESNTITIFVYGENDSQGNIDPEKIRALEVFSMTDHSDHQSQISYQFHKIDGEWELRYTTENDTKNPDTGRSQDVFSTKQKEGQKKLTTESFDKAKAQADAIINQALA